MTFIYTIVFLGLCLLSTVHGSWSQWRPYGRCSRSCGGGDEPIYRDCLNRWACSGREFNTRNCNNFPCPVDGGWENWESWTSCSATCGGGYTSRERSCDAPVPDFGGKFCVGGVAKNIDNEGVEWQWARCNTFRCEGDPLDTVYPPVQLPELPDSATTTPDPAAATKDPVAQAERPLPPPPNTNNQIGSPATSPAAAPPTPVDTEIGWKPWTPWGFCTTSCAGGRRFRLRFCANPGSGGQCNGANVQSMPCNEAVPCFGLD